MRERLAVDSRIGHTLPMLRLTFILGLVRLLLGAEKAFLVVTLALTMVVRVDDTAITTAEATAITMEEGDVALVDLPVDVAAETLQLVRRSPWALQILVVVPRFLEFYQPPCQQTP